MERRGKLRPTVPGHSLGAFPCVPDGAGASLRGLDRRQKRLGAACIGLAYPSPGRGLSASRWRSGRVPAVAPMAHKASREPGTREGDKSERSSTPRGGRRATLRVRPGEPIIDQRRSDLPNPVRRIHRLENPQKLEFLGVFAFQALETNSVIMLLFPR